MFKIINKLPEDVPTSPDLVSSAKGWFEVTLYGKYYYVPLTKEFQKVLKIKKINGEYKMPTWKSNRLLELALMDMIAGVSLQIKDTIGADIHRKLSEQITDGLAQMFDKKLTLAITDGFQKQLPIIKRRNNG